MTKKYKSLAETTAKAVVAWLVLQGNEAATNVLLAFAWLGVFVAFWLVLVIAHETPAGDKFRAVLAKDDRPDWVRTAGRATSLLCAAALAAAGSVTTAVLYAIAIVIAIGCEGYARERAAEVKA